MGARVLVLVENLSVPFDRRVWQETTTLARAGYEVVVACPQGETCDRDPLELRDGVEIHRFPLTPSGGGAVGYAREYSVALWRIRRLARKLARERPFDVVHACNPPDFLLLAALSLRRQGARFVFDHHDLFPELFRSRYGRGEDIVVRSLLALERLSFRLADVVLSTNESYRQIAIERGGKHPDDVFVVRNGPDLSVLAPKPPDPELRRGKPHLLAYVGMMGPQDGVDHAVRTLAALRSRRSDWHAIFLGDGDARPEAQRLAGELGLGGAVEFRGLVSQAEIARVLATADVGIAPDPSSPLNDLSTFMKVAEYMAMSCPVASFDLRETRVTAGDAAVYARPNDEAELAACIDVLLEDPDRRVRMGETGRRRVEQTLAWEHSERALLAAYDRALYRLSSAPASGRPNGRGSPSRSEPGTLAGSPRPIAMAPGTRWRSKRSGSRKPTGATTSLGPHGTPLP